MGMARAKTAGLLLRNALRNPSFTPRRSFSSSALLHKDEAAKWDKIACFGIASCSLFAIYNSSELHSHHDDTTSYPYFHTHNKEFWIKSLARVGIHTFDKEEEEEDDEIACVVGATVVEGPDGVLNVKIR